MCIITLNGAKSHGSPVIHGIHRECFVVYAVNTKSRKKAGAALILLDIFDELLRQGGENLSRVWQDNRKVVIADLACKAMIISLGLL